MRGGGPAPERIWGAWAGERTWEMIRVCCAEEKKHLGGLSLSWGRRSNFLRTMENQGNAPQQIAILDKINGLNIKLKH